LIPNCGDVAKLNDGKLPKGEDEPDDNFFFDAGPMAGDCCSILAR